MNFPSIFLRLQLRHERSSCLKFPDTSVKTVRRLSVNVSPSLKNKTYFSKVVIFRQRKGLKLFVLHCWFKSLFSYIEDTSTDHHTCLRWLATSDLYNN